ncbi:holin-associated N-acetylmuramidase [Solirhodobacter olei]|uniref:holin-associated N-acetylmuramidase n=1 Tax=Solirhodobacter olei TaxID=2493082 RepID=UPI000FDA2461|nr:holin-associated N-acetylmuramidase [Solirhodobacter olei]
MDRVEEIARQIVAREGGFVDDPADPGGPTNHGVTLATLRRLKLDLDGDGAVTVADLKALTSQRAAEIFVAEYFRAPRLDLLPEPLQPEVFDMYVNAGAEAVRLLQRLVTRMGFACAVDGVVGPQTAGAARNAAAQAPGHIVDAYGIARRNTYYALADARPALRKFARARDGGKGGWIMRAESFIAPRYRLTAEQHAGRCAAWG